MPGQIIFMDTINIGTIFSGVGTPEWALKKMPLDYKAVFMCDIDKYARQTYLANHDVEHVYEDVTSLDGKPFRGIVNLLVGGFPCQSFSIAGKRGGFEDTRGTLFFECARLVKEIDPDVFIFENVKGLLSHDGGKTFKTICNVISDLGYYSTYKVLNTKHYGIPQNRERIYIVGFKSFEHYDNFSFPQTFRLKLRLKDMLDSDVDEKYYLSDQAILSMFNKDNLQKCQVNPEVTSSLQSPGHACGIYKGCSFIEDPISNDLTTVQKDKFLMVPNIPIDNKKRSRVMESCVKDGDDICPTITATNCSKNADCQPWIKTNRIRRLTPRECARLQGFSDDFILPCSDTQSYRQMGNGMSVNVLIELFKSIYLHRSQQRKLF